MCIYRHKFLFFLCLIFGLSLLIPSASAFDNDTEINDINMVEENFLDIKAHRFRKSLEYQWYDNTTGWRMTGASLNSDLAFIQTGIKLQHELSEYVNFRLEIEDEVFYADKEFPSPVTEVEIYPWAGSFGFSLFGTPAFAKRDIDLGVALIWGKRPWNYTRFEYVDVDANYNKKNVIDNTFYITDPKDIKIEGAYQFGGHYKLRFNVKREKPLELINPDNNGTFKHEGYEYFLLLDYQPVPDSVLGITINGFALDKSKIETRQNQQQATDYISIDAYWVQGMGKRYELRFGSQYDHITNDVRDFITTNNDLDYLMKTLQIYATAYHRYSEHMAWDFGFYVGDVEEKQNYLRDNNRNTLNDGIEAKFRTGFEYSSSDGRSSLQLNISLNIDDLFTDPTDGGGISFQSVF